MDIQAEKLEIMKLLLEANDPEVLGEVKAVFEKKLYDFYDDLPDHVKESIDKGLQDFKEGRVFEHVSVMQDIRLRHGLKG